MWYNAICIDFRENDQHRCGGLRIGTDCVCDVVPEHKAECRYGSRQPGTAGEYNGRPAGRLEKPCHDRRDVWSVKLNSIELVGVLCNLYGRAGRGGGNDAVGVLLKGLVSRFLCGLLKPQEQLLDKATMTFPAVLPIS
jgi:hypothetical protein